MRALVAGAVLTVLALGAVAAWIAVASESSGDSQPTVSAPAAAPARSPSSGSTPSAAPTSAAESLAGKVVAIDPGHNGGNASHAAEINRTVDIGNGRKACDTAGAETADGYTEAAYNLDVARRLRRVLKATGARVVMTRTTNTGVGPCIDKRAEIGNRAHADAAISIHADGGPSSGRGFHVIYPAVIPGLTDDIAVASKRLALDVRAAYQRGARMPRADYIGRDGLDQRGDLGGLNLSDVPKVFIETGNMNNPADARHVERAAFRQRVASAIADGIAHYLRR